ncbi:U4/U6 snRNP-specific spliceosomal protein [Catenaria anguillulae PL171]|uniref:U4/U6 snRNP-specific spliceosomal protein n=1 Tax=Catenaria anguillulae PL171 TaxID=765915 RepID=A0A1Y2HKH4_9FUNG|nr:U4/U6 snRNP-specific spliceosomal protein [Catenaria anguillulae PL171]
MSSLLPNQVDFEDLMELDTPDDTEIPESMAKAKAEQAAIMEHFEKRKKLRSIAVPTDDNLVRAKLRELQHPITLFGEGPAERRDRLRVLISELEGEGVTVTFDVNMEEEEDDEDEEYWTPGTDELLFSRRWIANYSLRRARTRIIRQRAEFDTPVSIYKTLRRDLYNDLRTWTSIASQIVDERPTSFVTFAPDGKSLATGSFGGAIKLWTVPQCNPIAELRGHQARIGGIAWHPQATVGLDRGVCNLVSGAEDGTVRLWSLDQETPLATMEGHQGRVVRVAYHPSGRFVGSASFDGTWRLWDTERAQCLLEQDGHSREVFCIAMHPDGSLVSTGGLDGLAKVWDLRTGRCILNLQGHLKQVLSVDFHPTTGYQLATGSEDNSIKIWDMRAVKCTYTIPAHTNLVSQVKYFSATRLPVADDFQNPATAGKYVRGHPNTSGMFLIAGGFDGTVSMWSEGDYVQIKKLQGHDGKVMSVDVSADARFIASAGYDRTFKLWGSGNLQL